MIFFIVGFIASIVGAISGLGGGVIIKPVLDAVTTLDASVISFYQLVPYLLCLVQLLLNILDIKLNLKNQQLYCLEVEQF